MSEQPRESRWQRLNRWAYEHRGLFLAGAVLFLLAVGLVVSLAVKDRSLDDSLWIAVPSALGGATGIWIAMAIRGSNAEKRQA